MNLSFASDDGHRVILGLAVAISLIESVQCSINTRKIAAEKNNKKVLRLLR